MTVICRCDASRNQEDPEPARKRVDDVKCRECSGRATRDMASSSTSSRALFVWTLVLFTTFCYGVRAAPEALSRRHSDFNIPIPPAVLQELQELGLTENVLQEMKQTEEMAAVLELIQQYQRELKQNQQQQQTDYDTNRQDSGNPPAPENYSSPPIPMTLPTKFFRSQEAPTREENKRANHYTYACHFKICNIGRRQNYRRSPWIRRWASDFTKPIWHPYTFISSRYTTSLPLQDLLHGQAKSPLNFWSLRRD